MLLGDILQNRSFHFIVAFLPLSSMLFATSYPIHRHKSGLKNVPPICEKVSHQSELHPKTWTA
jgi:hypothetical protein